MADPAAGVAADTTTLGDDFPSLGLSHAWLVAWKDDMLAKGRISPASTTTDVCEAVVKPETIESNCSFAQKHINDASQGIGKATHFVSHAWKYSFCDLVSAIEIFALSLPPDEAKTAFFWVDLFVVDQHHAPSRPHSWWSSTFVDAIRSFGKVVLVFQPLLDPIPLTRAWCLWEIFTAIQTGACISLAMPTEQWTNYRVSLRQDYHAVIDSLQRVDARNAEAWNPRDKEEIFHAIEVSVGFDELNRRVRQLVAGILLVGVTRHACQDNNLQRITDILALEPDINTVSTFLTPLGVASDMNSPLVVDFLLARGADVNARMAWGHTPLHIACRAGHAHVVRLLLLGGANPDLVNEAGRTPLEEADAVANSQDNGSMAAKTTTLPKALERAIKTAKNAINSLTKSDVNALRSMCQPPPALIKVFKGVVLILGYSGPSNPEELKEWWEVGRRKLLPDPCFIPMLSKSYDKFEAILTTDIAPIEDIMALANDPESQPNEIKSWSKAMWAFCLWVRCYIVAYQVKQECITVNQTEDALQAKSIQDKHIAACVECIAVLREAKNAATLNTKDEIPVSTNVDETPPS